MSNKGSLRNLSVNLLIGTAAVLASFTCAAQTQHTSQFEVGPAINEMYMPVATVGSVTNQPGLGLTGALNIKRWFGIDGSLSVTPNSTNSETSNAGGHLTQFALGARAGFTKGRFRVYGKLRPGLVSFSHLITLVDPTPPVTFHFGSLTAPSLDAGGIVQIDLVKRFSLRFDAGDTMIGYPSRTVIARLRPAPAQTTHNFEFGIGFMFHFR